MTLKIDSGDRQYFPIFRQNRRFLAIFRQNRHFFAIFRQNRRFFAIFRCSDNCRQRLAPVLFKVFL